MLKKVAIVFGIVFLAIGVLGFVPCAMRNGDLFGLLHVNSLHNFIHILTGLVALWAAFAKTAVHRTFFQVFGIIYAIFALLGFVYSKEAIFGVIANNMADAWFHLVIALIALYCGFIIKVTSRSKRRR